MQTNKENGFLQGNCPELGAVLKEIKQQYINSRAMTIAALVASMSFFLLLCGGDLTNLQAFDGSRSYDFSFVGISVGLLGFFFTCWLCFTRERCLRFHENGVSLLQAGKETQIAYAQLTHCSFKKTKLHISDGNKHYSTTFELELKSNSTNSITWAHTADRYLTNRSLDKTDYDWLNHHLSRIAADNIAEHIEMGHKVSWGKSAFIQNAGLEIKKETGLLSSEMTFVPWSDIKDIQFRDGQLSLEVGKPQSAQSWNATIQCDQENVLPGYLVIKKRLKSQAESPVIADQSEVEISTALTSKTRTFTPYYGGC